MHDYRELAAGYFELLAAKFPVMCASDEFHFLPRVEAAATCLDRVDSFAADAVGACVQELQDFRALFSRQAAEVQDPEALVDLELLQGSVAGVLLELEQTRSWRHNPLLYLKVAFIGLEQVLQRAGGLERREALRIRLEAIPRLLAEAEANIDSVPLSYQQAAMAMTLDCQAYLHEQAKGIEVELGTRGAAILQSVRTNLERFGRWLGAMEPHPDRTWNGPEAEVVLRQHFRSSRTLEEIYQIGAEEWQRSLQGLERWRREIEPHSTWEELYHAYLPALVKQEQDTIELYRGEVERLRNFFHQRGFGDLGAGEDLQVVETPRYLRSVRSSASFSAPCGPGPGEPSLFYITTAFGSQLSPKAARRLQRRLHREYRFLAAHETVPGHHLLDSVRRRLANPIRRQVESALFYEGWAYYAETLLEEYGYISDPLEMLVDNRRRLWRAGRCLVDTGMASGRLTAAVAAELLAKTGVSLEEARRQVDRFKLNPGYQLCYSLGRYEIEALRRRFAPLVGLERFHRLLLEGGQPPFAAAAKRLAAVVTAEKNANHY